MERSRLGLRLAPRSVTWTDSWFANNSSLFIQHYILNEQETNRNPGTEDGVDIAAVSSNIDDKTMHELYLWPFQDAVLAGSASIMCSYNRVNNSYGCQNSKTLNGLLKTELGFQGTSSLFHLQSNLTDQDM
jgi:hypothetical protein